MTSAEPELDDVLLHGELTVQGRLVDASNATLLCNATLGDVTLQCIYKPSAGERPLWDFPNNDLAEREVATHLLDTLLGWNLTPRTLLRDEGPYGRGMVQEFIDIAADVDCVDVVSPGQVPDGWLTVLEARDGDDNPVLLIHADRPELQRLAVLDAIANNGDRKGGHVLVATDGRVYGIDHGVTWHQDDKLRTVLWGWVETPLPDDLAADVRGLLDRWSVEAGPALEALLPADDVGAALVRAVTLLERGTFPLPSTDWPAIPWPVF